MSELTDILLGTGVTVPLGKGLLERLEVEGEGEGRGGEGRGGEGRGGEGREA